MEIAFTISTIGKDETVLEDEAGNLITWPRNKLPSDLKIGDQIFFYISKDKSQEIKNILNEILNPQES